MSEAEEVRRRALEVLVLLAVAACVVRAGAPVAAPVATPSSPCQRESALTAAEPPEYVTVSKLQLGPAVQTRFDFVSEGVRVEVSGPDDIFARAGLRSGDVLVEWNDHCLAGPRDLLWTCEDTASRITLVYLRGGHRRVKVIDLTD